MPLYKVYLLNVQQFTAVVEAVDWEDAEEIAQNYRQDYEWEVDYPGEVKYARLDNIRELNTGIVRVYIDKEKPNDLEGQ